VCRALKVLCAAADTEGLTRMKRATVSGNWELVGGARSVEELSGQAELHRPDVIVVDAALGPPAVEAALAARPDARIVSVGSLPGAHAVASSLEDLRDAVLGSSRPSGPVAR
jgi:hypothetical protein